MTRRIWLISDIHADHTNVISLSNRPFANVQDMVKVIVDNINKVVRVEDVLYFVGDVCLGKREAWVNFLKQINCKTLILIRGNHDRWASIPKEMFVGIYDSVRLLAFGQTFLVSHYPYRVSRWRAFWKRLHHATYAKQRPKDSGLWLLHGHTHQKTQLVDYHPRMFNVGVDANKFKPIAIDDIISIIQRLKSQKEAGHVK